MRSRMVLVAGLALVFSAWGVEPGTVCGDGICHNSESNWSCPADCPPSHPNSSILYAGQALFPGQQALSTDGRFQLTYQSDGNLVLTESSTPIWDSGTQGTDAGRALMQTDGNLVIYTPSNQPVWNSGSGGNPRSRLIVQNDGNAVVYSAGGKALWASNTCCR